MNPSPPNLLGRFSRGAAWAISAAAVAITGTLIARYRLSVPWRDHWAVLGQMLKFQDQGKPLLEILWAPFGEQRWFVGRLMEMANLSLTGGIWAAEMYALLALAAAGAVAAWLLGRPLVRQASPALAYWLLPMLVLVAVSPGQMENWLGAYYGPPYLMPPVALAGLVVLVRRPLSWPRFGIAACCGIVVTLCYSCGLVYWIAALVPLLGLRPEAKGRPWGLTAAWLVLTVAAWVFYFRGFGGLDYQGPGNLAPPLGIGLFAELPRLAWFGLALLGNPIGVVFPPGTAIAFFAMPALGLFGVGVIGVAVYRIYRRPGTPPLALAWLGYAVYGVLVAASITFGRQTMGNFLPMSSRYGVLLWPFWAAVFVLGLWVWTAPGLRPASAAPNKTLLQRALTPGTAIALFIVFMFGTLNTHVQRWWPNVRDRKSAVLELPDLCAGNAEIVGLIAPPSVLADNMPILAQHGLVRFPLEPFASNLVAPAEAAGKIETVSVETVLPVPGAEPCLRIAGRASPAPRGAKLNEVLLVANGEVVKRTPLGEARAHVGPDYDRDPDPASGWVLHVDLTRLPASMRRFDVYAPLQGTGKFALIGTVSQRPRSETWRIE